ncbi:hypothetical protein GCK32_007870, partial [Trichostrongylus colubriformis]
MIHVVIKDVNDIDWIIGQHTHFAGGFSAARSVDWSITSKRFAPVESLSDLYMAIWIWPFLVPFACSTKVTPEQNAEITKTCGDFFLKRAPVHKSFGGAKFRKNEYPWIASLEIGSFICSGALISRRHILTAAHCAFYTSDPAYYKDQCQKMGYRNTRRAKSDKWRAFVGSQCVDPNKCELLWRTPVHFYYHNDFNECSLENDIAIFELGEDISSRVATPICLPKSNQAISKELSAAGSGWRGIPSKQPDVAPAGQYFVNVTFFKMDDIFIQVKAPSDAGICP